MLLFPRRVIHLRTAHTVHETKLRLQNHFDASRGFAVEKSAINEKHKENFSENLTNKNYLEEQNQKGIKTRNKRKSQGLLLKKQHKNRDSNEYGSFTFTGNLYQQRFVMVRESYPENSFSPVISGHLQSSDYGTAITANVKLPFQMIKLAVIWYALTGIASLVTVPLYFSQPDAEWYLLSPAFLFIAMIFLVQYGFSKGAMHLEEDLEKLLDGKAFRRSIDRTHGKAKRK